MLSKKVKGTLMLLEFSVQNFRSIKEKITLSMVASKGDEHLETHTVSALSQDHSSPSRRKTLLSDMRLLRSVAIYGANAAGKSNLLKAFDFMRDQITTSVNTQSGHKIDVQPHLFDVRTQKEPTEVEAIFVIDNVMYQYGFTATAERIHKEWLIAYPSGKPQLWISRLYDPKTDTYDAKISEKVKGPRKHWIELNRKDVLLLSTAVQFNSDQLRPILDWFQEKCFTMNSARVDFGPYTLRFCANPESKKRVVDAMKAADLGIKDISSKKKKIAPSSLPKGMPESIKKELIGEEIDVIFARHNVEGGSDIEINLGQESDGTQKFFSLIGPWLSILDNGETVFVDELSDNLHPLMMRFLVAMFHNNVLNRKGAQLIFTAHDTSLLKSEYLRRDQIWFAEKKTDNSTKFYPLTDFKPRKHGENIEKNYLGGNYGALPYLRDIAQAMGVLDEQ